MSGVALMTHLHDTTRGYHSPNKEAQSFLPQDACRKAAPNGEHT